MEREELKASLRDWMTATCQLMKINKKSDSKIYIEDVTFWWKFTFGIRMRYKWAEKAYQDTNTFLWKELK